jgi:hypothetical protein
MDELDEVVDVALDYPVAVGSTASHRPPIERRSTTRSDELVPWPALDLDHRLAKVVPPVTHPYAVDREVRLDLSSTDDRDEAAHLDQLRRWVTATDHHHETTSTLAHRRRWYVAPVASSDGDE